MVLYPVILRLKQKPDYFKEVTDILNKSSIVTQIYRVTGRDKLHVHAVASSNEEMEHFLHDVIRYTSWCVKLQL